jgi:hypothetical protein
MSRIFAVVLCLCATVRAAEPEYREPTFSRSQRSHWAFQPVSPQRIPIVRDRAWVRTPIDAFILAKLEAAGVPASPEADRLTWLRRVSFDLTGLPPTIAEQDAFLADRSSNA